MLTLFEPPREIMDKNNVPFRMHAASGMPRFAVSEEKRTTRTPVVVVGGCGGDFSSVARTAFEIGFPLRSLACF